MSRTRSAPYDVRGRTAFITGAARGIGKASAERLHKKGANVALVGLEPERLEENAAALGERAFFYEADVTDLDAMQDAVAATVERFGGIDVAVANAGIAFIGALATAPVEQVERTLAVNLLGVWRTDRAVIDQIMTLLLAGHETTTTGLAWAFERLLRHPETLSRAREGDDDYLDAVVKETLRLRPVIDAAERTLTEPRVVAGFELPAGVKVYPGIALVHMREDLYPRAHEFRPERFADAGAESYSWLPFGGGIRRCIGAALAQAEIAEVLRTIVPRVELRPLRERPDPVVLRGITLAPKHGVRVLVERVLRPGGSSSESPAHKPAEIAA